MRKFPYKVFPYAEIKHITNYSYDLDIINISTCWLNNILFYNIDGQWSIQESNNKIIRNLVLDK